MELIKVKQRKIMCKLNLCMFLCNKISNLKQTLFQNLDKAYTGSIQHISEYTLYKKEICASYKSNLIWNIFIYF